MANVEIATFKRDQVQQLNISNVVGVGGANERNDVMLIQALFKLVGYIEALARKNFGMAKNELPEITGNLDSKTIQTIYAFQRHNVSRLLNADGKIHPASYKNRILKNPYFGRLMTITLLNVNAMEGVVEMGFDLEKMDQAVRKLAPSIKFI